MSGSVQCYSFILSKYKHEITVRKLKLHTFTETVHYIHFWKQKSSANCKFKYQLFSQKKILRHHHRFILQ